MFNVSFHLPVCVKMKAWHTQEYFKLGHIVFLNFHLILIMSGFEVKSQLDDNDEVINVGWWLMMTVSDIYSFLFNLSLSRDSYCPEANFWIIGNLLNRFQSEAGLWVPWQDKSISFTKSGSQESHYVKSGFFFLLNPPPLSHKLSKYRLSFT